MLKIRLLAKYFHMERVFFPVVVLTLMISVKAECQNYAFVNNGCNIYVQGPSSVNTNPAISIHGSFLNLFDGLADGRIEENGGNILLDSNWINNANNNVFTNFSGSNKDGFVTLRNTKSVQFIEGSNPTHFENLYLNEYRKQLLNDDNLVNGVLYLDAAFVLNSKNFIINNPNPLSINYISGFIKSETFPGNYSTLQWNIGSGLGTYRIPFGDDYTFYDNLNLIFEIKTPVGASDYFKFATYPTDMYNQPMPTGASPLELEPRKVVDRYWIINPSDPFNKPAADITFTFSSHDVDASKNSIKIQKLKASRNNVTIGKWLDMTPRGSAANNTVTIENVTPNEFYPVWTLVNIPGPLSNVFVPDAFTPDGDGVNDEFIPVFQVDFEVTSYEFYIFDRWGNVLFHTSDTKKGWNGRKNNVEGEPLVGVYSWLIIVKGFNKKDSSAQRGERLVGRVTLLL